MTKTLPDLIPDTELTLPPQAERKLPNGLTVIAIRRAAVPLVEVRLRIPFGRAPLAPATVLSQAMFTGTGSAVAWAPGWTRTVSRSAATRSPAASAGPWRSSPGC